MFSGFHKWLAENDNDVRWANTVAAAFEKAGGEGGLSTLPNSAIDAALKAAHVDETREDLVIQMPSALGHPPTTGYSNDPVNTSTGNFIETEQDVEFLEAAAELSWNRSYNSLSRNAGAFGTGWTSWTETGLTFDDEAAYFTGPDGRQLTFPRLGDGWDRAIGESQWLARVQAGDDADGAALVARDNQGTRWGFTESGRPLWVDHGPGTRVTLEWEQAEDGDRLTGLTHARGRSLTLEWGVAAGTARVVALRASDGRRVDYSYDESGRLVAAHGPLGTRAYRWNDDDLISAVIDADGVAALPQGRQQFSGVEIVHLDLRGDENLVPLQPALPHGFADALLRAVGLRRVEVAIACFERAENGCNAIRACPAPCPKA